MDIKLNWSLQCKAFIKDLIKEGKMRVLPVDGEAEGLLCLRKQKLYRFVLRDKKNPIKTNKTDWGCWSTQVDGVVTDVTEREDK